MNKNWDWDPSEEICDQFCREERQDMKTDNMDLSASIAERISACEEQAEEEENEWEDPGLQDREEAEAENLRLIDQMEPWEGPRKKFSWEDGPEEYENSLQEEGPPPLTAHEVGLKILSAGIALRMEYDQQEVLYHLTMARYYQRQGWPVHHLGTILSQDDLKVIFDDMYCGECECKVWVDDPDIRQRRMWNIMEDKVDVMKWKDGDWIVVETIKF